MDGHARAGIDIYGKALRYAEIEQQGSQYHLLRLGSLDFDFDVTDAILDATAQTSLETLTDALTDVFEGSAASRLYVAVHPPACYSFFTPLPKNLESEERKNRLLSEAALLTRSASPQPLRLTADPVFTETLEEDNRDIEWFHVLALKERLHTRFDRVFRMMPQAHYRMTLSMHAVAKAMAWVERRTEATEPTDAPFTLAIGWYPTHVEYTLCRDDHWYFSHYTEAEEPANSVYFALLLLDRLHLKTTSVRQVYLYGGHRDLDDFMLLRDVFPTAPALLEPTQHIDLHERHIAGSFSRDAYAPCIGVAL